MELSRAELQLLHMLIVDRAKKNPMERNGFILRLDRKLQAEESWHATLTSDAHDREITEFMK